MNQLKELLHDQTNGTINFKCPVCDEPVHEDVQLQAPEYDDGGPEPVVETVFVTCETQGCFTDFEVEIVVLPYQITASILGRDVLVHVREAPPESEDYYESVEDPLGVFQGAIDGIKGHMERYRPSAFHELSFHHMLLTSLFSAFEAYLADQLIELALDDKGVRRRLLSQAEGLKDIRVGLIEVEQKPDLIEDQVKKSLRAISFHNLKRTESLYDIALSKKQTLSKPLEARRILDAAVPVRHDCVHRNGRTADGNLRLEVTPEYLLKVADAMIRMVWSIDRTISPAEDNLRLPF